MGKETLSGALTRKKPSNPSDCEIQEKADEVAQKKEISKSQEEKDELPFQNSVASGLK